MCYVVLVIFFFSSRRRHTRYWRDWSSDVCSSDLDPARGPFVQLGEGELAGPVDGDEQVQLALLGADLGDVEVEVADRVDLEALLSGGTALRLGQPGDAVPGETAMEIGAREARDGWLEGVEAVVQGQQRVPAKGDDDGFLLGAEDGRASLLRSHPAVEIGR